MIGQDLALCAALAGAASFLVAFGRLARGATAAAVAAHVRVTVLACGATLAAVCAAIALAPSGVFRGGLGMVDAGGSATPIGRTALARLAGAAGALAGAALVAMSLRAGRGGVTRLLDRCSPDARRLGRQVRADARALRRRFGLPAIAVAAAVAVVAAAAVRLRLAAQPVSYDEAITFVHFAARSPLDIVSDYSIPNNHVLHSLLVHLSSRIAGAGEFAVRAPALVAGVLLVPASGWLALRTFGARSAPFAAALVAGEPGLCEYSAQARGYTLLGLLVVLAMVALSYAVRGRTLSAWCLFSLAMAAALHTVPTALMAFYGAGAWLLLSRDRSRAALVRFALASLAAGAIAVVLYAPAIVCSGPRSLVANPYVRALGLAEFAERARITWQDVVRGFAGPLPAAAVAAFLAALLVGAAAGSRRGRTGARLLGALALGVAVVAVTQRTVPPPRTLLLAFPFIAAVAARGVAAAIAPVRSRAVLAALAIAAGVAVPVAWSEARAGRAASVTAAAAAQGVADPGAEGVNCWAEGYFVDAEAAAAWAASGTSADRPLVVHLRSGMSETTRFYLCGLGVPLSRVHPYRPDAGIAQLGAYEGVFVLLLRTSAGPPGMDAVSAALEVPVAGLDAEFEPPVAVRSFVKSEIVALRRRPGTPDARPVRNIDLFEYPR